LSAENLLIDGERGIVSNAVISGGVIASETALKTSIFSGMFLELKPGLNSLTISGTGLNISSIQYLYRHTYL
jgi:hypothetical protein